MEQALVAIAGAIVVALITAVTTTRRLTRQLKAESEHQERTIEAQEDRQRSELEAADERHRATLQADRDLADLADERALLDEVAITLYRANDAVDDVRLALIEHGKSIGEHRPEVLEMLRAHGRDLDALLARASIRFDSDESLMKSLYTASTWLDLISMPLAWLEDDDRASWQAKHEKLDGDIEKWVAGMGAFQREAVFRVGSRPGFGY